MKKHLIAAAVAGAFAVPAMAQVTVFGVADIGYRTAKWTDAGIKRAEAVGIADGAMAGNRFGFRGSEDLGGGLKANFHIEHGISLVSSGLTDQRQGSSSLPVSSILADSGRTTGVNRQSWAGLSGGFGEIRLGYQYNNLYEVSTLSGFNLGSEGTNGADTAHTMTGVLHGGTRGNGVTYMTPVFSGIQIAVQYGGAGDQFKYSSTGSTSSTSGADSYGVKSTSATSAGYDTQRTSVRAKYQAGPLHAQVAQTNVSAKTSVAGSTVFGAAAKSELTQFGASYNLGIATVAGTYAMGEPTATTENTGFQIGVRVPVGAMSLIASTGSYEQETKATKAKTADVSQTQIGVQYSLSKRTTAYMYSGQTKDKATGGIDKKASTIIGVLHTF
jgi:predicted porin